ncbi:MAG TPA: tetratricopeptide repeat protein [Candidatus Acidoferrum sp.]|nr:tetratricopeptide repeat protein [Candidatus Acidoferrum sp.]
MQLQDTSETFFFKLWPWIEANKIRLIGGGGIIIVVVGLVSLQSHRRAQTEMDAGMALTQLMMSDPRNNSAENQAGLFFKLAGQYRGTAAGQRALVQSAAMLFEGRKYVDAQAQFQQFLGEYPDSLLAPQAALGLAACLDAQGKADAAAAYQRVASSYSDSIASPFAKFRLAQIDEQSGKTTEALNLYEDVARATRGSSLGSQAALRAMELKQQNPAPPASAAPAIPVKSNSGTP